MIRLLNLHKSPAISAVAAGGFGALCLGGRSGNPVFAGDTAN
jgi:hypothetical protein